MTRSASALLMIFTLVPTAAPSWAEDAADAEAGVDKVVSGMSIVGNDEAPKSLVIVPWKSSDLGQSPGVSESLDHGRRPVDRDVFERALDYYEIRAGLQK